MACVRPPEQIGVPDSLQESLIARLEDLELRLEGLGSLNGETESCDGAREGGGARCGIPVQKLELKLREIELRIDRHDELLLGGAGLSSKVMEGPPANGFASESLNGPPLPIAEQVFQPTLPSFSGMGNALHDSAPTPGSSRRSSGVSVSSGASGRSRQIPGGVPRLSRRSTLNSHEVLEVNHSDSEMTRAEVKELMNLISSEKHQVKESVWDAAMFIGLPVVGTWSSWMVAVALAINTTAQFFFVILLVISRHTFIQEDHASVEDMRKWRTWAHDISHMVSSMSLPTAVCGLDASLAVSAQQVKVLTEIEAYTSPFGVITCGEMLCVLVNLLWFLTVSKEVKECIGLMSSLLAMDSAKRTRLKVQDDLVMFEHMSRSRKFATIALTLVRSCIAMLLLMFGSVWLSRTWSVQNMILDAASLAFILEFDELLFHTITPRRIRSLVAVFGGLQVSQRRMSGSLNTFMSGLSSKGNMSFGKAFGRRWLPKLKDFDWSLFFTWVCGLLVIIYVTEKQVLANLELMGQLTGAMCDQTEYVYLNKFPLVLTAQTMPFGEETRLQAHVNEALSGIDIRHVSSPNINVIIRESDESLAALFPEACHDEAAKNVKPTFNFAGVIEATVEHYANITFRSCEDVRQFCNIYEMELVRFYCPVTCGCGSPLSGLRFTTGCPASCEVASEYVEELANISCADPTAAEILTSTGWEYFWASARFVEWPEDLAGNAHAIDQLIQHGGCSGMAGQNISAAEVMEQLQARYCGAGEHASAHGSLRRFCPVSCGCLGGGLDCPPSCTAQQ